MGIFSRLFRISRAEVHSVIDGFENPIKIIEQGIRDLKEDLHKFMISLAEVKGFSIQMEGIRKDNKNFAMDHESKAILLLKKTQNGQLDMTVAEYLATEAIMKQGDCLEKATEYQKQHEQQQKIVDQLQVNINKLKLTIFIYENDLITLKARSQIASSVKKINQQAIKTDPSSTITMLNEMKAKVETEESLAAVYSQMATESQSIDDEIATALADDKQAKAIEKLNEMKAKLGITQ